MAITVEFMLSRGVPSCAMVIVRLILSLHATVIVASRGRIVVWAITRIIMRELPRLLGGLTVHHNFASSLTVAVHAVLELTRSVMYSP